MNKLRLTYFYALLAAVLFFTACEEDEPLTATVSFSEETYTLQEDASEPLAVQVEINPNWEGSITIPFTVGGTAIEGTDYETITPKSFTVPAGENTAEILVTPIDNNFVEDQARTIELNLGAPAVEGVTVGMAGTTTITLENDDEAGAVTVSFAEASLTTNEYLQDTVEIEVTTNTTFPEDIELSYTLGGDAVAGTNFTAPDPLTVTIPTGETSAVIEVPVLNTDSYDASSTVEFALEAPDNAAIELGADATATLTIINPQADVRLFAPDEDFARLYAYNTFEDVAVPATGRNNDDPNAGALFEESFAFTYYDPENPNSLGFVSPLWSEEAFTRNTNAFNMIDLYSSGPDEYPNTVDENISAGSAGIAIFEAIRLVPTAVDATSGIAIVPEQEVTVYRRDETDDDVDNPTSFVIGISGEGTYDETEGVINLTVTFDETEIGNGTQVRRYVMPTARREQ